MQTFLCTVITRSIAAVVAVVLVFGVLHFSLEKQSQGYGSNCPFDVHDVMLCEMTVSDYVRNVQGVFSVTPVKSILSLIGIVLALLALVSSVQRFRFIYRKLLVYTYIRSGGNERTMPAEHFLKYALARGILNPKTF